MSFNINLNYYLFKKNLWIKCNKIKYTTKLNWTKKLFIWLFIFNLMPILKNKMLNRYNVTIDNGLIYYWQSAPTVVSYQWLIEIRMRITLERKILYISQSFIFMFCSITFGNKLNINSFISIKLVNLTTISIIENNVSILWITKGNGQRCV